MKNIEAFQYFRMFIQNYYYYLLRKEILSTEPDKKPTAPNNVSINPNVKYDVTTAEYGFEKTARPDFLDKHILDYVKLCNTLSVEYALVVEHSAKKIIKDKLTTQNMPAQCEYLVPDDFDPKNFNSFYHNHPSGWKHDYSLKGHGGTCFSPADMGIFYKTNMKTMYVSNPIFLYKVTKNKPIDQTKANDVFNACYWNDVQQNGEITWELPFLKFCKGLKLRYKRFLISKNAPCINLFSSKIKTTNHDVKKGSKTNGRTK